MIEKIRNLIRFGYDQFGPLIVFLLAEHTVGLKAAIGATVAFALIDLSLRHLRKAKITRLYLFVLSTTVIFGWLDLYLPVPRFFRYESVATNLLTAAFFAATLFRGQPLIQELVEKSSSPETLNRPDVQDYLRTITGVWVGYFIVKAAVYGWVSYHYTYDEAMAFRTLAGSTSLGVLIFGERGLRPRLFALFRALGFVRPPPSRSASDEV